MLSNFWYSRESYQRLQPLIFMGGEIGQPGFSTMTVNKQTLLNFVEFLCIEENDVRRSASRPRHNHGFVPTYISARLDHSQVALCTVDGCGPLTQQRLSS